MTYIAKVFRNGRSQAIRIPKEYRVDSDEVYIEKVGDSLVIRPKKKDKWENFFDKLRDVDTKDFMKNRKQLPIQDRELF